MSPLMGHLSPNHDVGRVMASLQPQNAPQGTFKHESCCSGYTGSSMVKIFSSVKRMFTSPFLACHWRGRFALVHRISFKAGVRRCPFECRCALMCRSSPMRHDLIGSIRSAFGTWSSVSKVGFSESAPVPFW